MAIQAESSNTGRYSPHGKEKDVLVEVQTLFASAVSERDRPQKFLGDRNFEDYINDCKLAFNSYPDSPNVPWGSNAQRPITRDRVLAVIAQMVSSVVEPQFIAQNDAQRVDREMSKVIDDLYTYSTDREMFDKVFVSAVTQGAVEGTIHILDEFRSDEREIKEIEDYDVSTGEVKYKTAKKRDQYGLYAEVIPNLEIYPGDTYKADIQEQPYMFRYRLMNYQSLKNIYSGYDRWDYVKPGTSWEYDRNEDDFVQKEETDEQGDLVGVLEYWNKGEDLYLLVVGGVLMTDPNNPIPYKHKSYPISKTVAEPFDLQFYWGNSIANKVRDEQKLLNRMYRMMHDKNFLSLFPPSLTNSKALIMEDVIVPATTTYLENGETFNVVGEMAGGVTNAQIAMQRELERSISESSVNPVTAGQEMAGSQTATEILTLERNARRMLGLYGIFIMFLIEGFARLRVSNILDFYPDMEDMDMITLHGATLTGGSKGSRRLEFTNLEGLTDAERLAGSFDLMNEEGEGEELVKVDKQALKNLDVFVKIKAAPEPRVSDALSQAVGREKFALYANLQGIDQQENLRQLVRSQGDDENRLINIEGGTSII